MSKKIEKERVIATIEKIVDDDELLEVGRRAVEDVLVQWRDSRLSVPLRNNGLVIREKDGRYSSIIRMGTEDAIKIGLIAIARSLKTMEVEATNPD